VIQMTNSFGIEAWNSYSKTFGRDLEMRVLIDVAAAITNQTGVVFSTNITQNRWTTPLQIPNGKWFGYYEANPAFSFSLPVNTNYTYVPYSAYSDTRGIFPLTDNAQDWSINRFPTTPLFLNLGSRVLYA